MMSDESFDFVIHGSSFIIPRLIYEYSFARKHQQNFWH